MGSPNGSGKIHVVLCPVWPKGGYEVTKAPPISAIFRLLDIDPEERAAAGLFLAFPVPLKSPVSAHDFPADG